MAIKDPLVLGRINTLNTSLESNNITEIERNVTTNLCNVLEGPMNISVDPEILASIEQVSGTSDFGARIAAQRLRLATRRVDIPYPTGAVRIANTVVTGPTNNAGETQSRINENQGYLDSLHNDLPSQIGSLRTRLEENQRIVNDINRIQRGLTGTLRSTRAINNDITGLQNLSNSVQQLNDLLTRIHDIETDRDYGTGSRRGNNLDAQRNTIFTNFNTIYRGLTWPAGIAPTGTPAMFNNGDRAITFMGYLRTINTNISTRINELTNQLTSIQSIEDLTNSLSTDRVGVPSYNLGFGAGETVVNRTSITREANSRAELNRINERLRNLQTLEDNIPRLRARYQENIDTLNRLLTLQNLNERLESRYPGEIGRRHNEFNLITDVATNYLWLRNPGYQSRLPNQTFSIGQTAAPIPLDFIHGTLRAGLTARYALCDGTGNPYRIDGGNIEIPLENGTTIRFSGMTFTPAGEMVVNNLTIVPIEGVTFPLNLNNLNVRVRIHDAATGLDIDHHKPINLEITGPNLSQADRLTAYNTLVPPMNDRIQAEYSDNYRENLENEAIWAILREGGNEAEVNEIYNNENRRNMLIDRIRTRLAGNIPLLTLADLQTRFRDDMTDINRNVPIQHLLSRPAFQNYVRQSIPNNLRTCALERISCNANANRNDILQELIDFQADIANNRVDNNDNLHALAQVPADNQGPRGLPGSFLQRLRGRRILARRNIKNNYTRFFEGRHSELNDLSLETEDGVINYSVRVDVLGLNKIVAKVNIDGKEEPEIIEASSHDRLIRGILTRANTKDGEPLNRKLRCNLALSVLKAMVAMSPQRLSRQIPTHNFMNDRGVPVPCNRIEADIHGGNLRIRGGMVDPVTRIRQNVTIFDEQQFKNLHDLNRLEQGIHELSTQINIIMNATATEYHRATSSIGRNHINRYVMKYDTVQRLRGGPIKRLRGNMLHGETSNTFDFSTSVNEAGKTVNINLTKGVFTVSGEFKGKHYEYKSRNLGSILRKKINRNRVFSGVELAMIAAINENFIQRLRENHRVQNENFVISDSNEGKSGRTYIFDASGDLSYLEIEDSNLNPLGAGHSGRINPTQVPTYRIRCNERERREFMQNPLLAGRLQRIMRRRLSVF